MLELSGERGYANLTVEALLERSETSRELFEAQFFGDLDACFAIAYELEAEALCAAVVGAIEASADWRGAAEAGLTTVLGYAAERPAVAKALVYEVHVAGGVALAKHGEVIERLTAVVEGCESPETMSIASSFVVGAVEGVISARVSRGEAEGALEALPELTELAISSLANGAL